MALLLSLNAQLCSTPQLLSLNLTPTPTNVQPPNGVDSVLSKQMPTAVCELSKAAYVAIDKCHVVGQVNDTTFRTVKKVTGRDGVVLAERVVLGAVFDGHRHTAAFSLAQSVEGIILATAFSTVGLTLCYYAE